MEQTITLSKMLDENNVLNVSTKDELFQFVMMRQVFLLFLHMNQIEISYFSEVIKNYFSHQIIYFNFSSNAVVNLTMHALKNFL